VAGDEVTERGRILGLSLAYEEKELLKYQSANSEHYRYDKAKDGFQSYTWRELVMCKGYDGAVDLVYEYNRTKPTCHLVNDWYRHHCPYYAFVGGGFSGVIDRSGVIMATGEKFREFQERIMFDDETATFETRGFLTIEECKNWIDDKA
jgi:hypothetical protein